MSAEARPQLDLAARVLDQVRARAGAAAQAEVTVDRIATAVTRFANSVIHQNVAERTTTVRLRLHVDGRTATGSTTLVSEEGIGELVDRTIGAARLLPPDTGWPGLAPPAPPHGTGVVDDAVITATPADRAAPVRDFVAAAGGLEAAGYCRTVHWSCGFANSAGHTAYGATTETAMDGIARDGHADGVARLAGPRLSDVDGGALGARAAAKARAGRDPIDLPPGRYEVVLEPTAVADLLGNLAMYGFNGKSVTEGRSFVRVDRAQFDPMITLIDDPVAGIGLPFDTEGTPKQRHVLVEAGVTRAVAHDRRTAHTAGATSTGHAVVPDSAAWGPFPANLSIDTAELPPIEVDGPAADSAVAALVARVRRGILVTDHWYTRVLDPRPLTVTGLTRNGVWLIENGEIRAPVHNLRFTQSYPAALAPGSVLGIGTHTVAQPSSWEMLSYRAAALHLASWHFTGGSSG